MSEGERATGEDLSVSEADGVDSREDEGVVGSRIEGQKGCVASVWGRKSDVSRRTGKSKALQVSQWQAGS